MGELGLLTERSAFAAAVNPALLALMDRPALSGTYGFLSRKEDWAFPAHDSFDAILGYNVYSTNSNLYLDGGLAASTGRLEQFFDICLGIAFMPHYDFEYDFYEEVRDRSTQSVPPDRLIAETYLEGTGVVRGITVSAGRRFGENLRLGAGVEYLFGDYDLTSRIEWADLDRETFDRLQASNLSGVRFRVGGVYSLNMRVQLGAGFTTGAELDADFQTETGSDLMGFIPTGEEGVFTGTIEYPPAYEAAITYRPRNPLETVVEAGVRFTRWSDFENGSFDELELDDVYEWHIGVEHLFYNKRPVRFGFIYSPTPKDDEISRSAVTVGTAITYAGFEVDMTGKIGWREFRQADLFDDGRFGAQSRDLTDQVEETFFSGLVTVSRHF
jgi:hypothetical protein